jgi:hypothetical protein
MSVFQPGQVSYGLTQPLIGVPSAPIISQRAPTTDDKANLGTLWINQATNLPYILTSVVDNIATWVPISNAASIIQIVTDSGTAIPIAGSINLFGGANIETSASANTIDVAVTPIINLPATNAAQTQGIYRIGGVNALFLYPPTSTFVGNAGNTTSNSLLAVHNVGVGNQALASVTTGNSNTALGASSLINNTTGLNNVAVGYLSMAAVTTGDTNIALGNQSLQNFTTGNDNIAIGFASGSSYTGAESSNILINNSGLMGETNTIRIGEQGSGAGQQDICYIAGVYAALPGATNEVMFVDNTGKLGSSTGTDGQVIIGSSAGSPEWANITAGSGVTITNGHNTITIAASGASGITTLDGDTGSATGATITLAGGHNMTTAASGATVTFNVSGTTQHSLLLGNATGSINSLGVATNGQIPIGSTGADPVLATLTAGANITITNGAGSITIASSGGGGGITTIDGNTGSATGSTVTFDATTNAGSSVEFEGASSTISLIVTDTGNNTLMGESAGNGSLTGARNTGFGRSSLANVTNAASNTCVGYDSCEALTSSSYNVAIGDSALIELVGGSGGNTAVGFQSLGITSGTNNIAIGFNAGSGYGGSESNNIVIGNNGSGGESNTIRIGDGSTQTAFYTTGVFGTTVDAGTGTAVFVDSTGLLGTVLSSRRYKEGIQSMGPVSASVLELRPVIFRYKNDPTGERRFGLIAEEVDEVIPDLVIYNKSGDPETVKYHDLPVLLLNELQKQHNVIADLSRRLIRLEERMRYESTR